MVDAYSHRLHSWRVCDRTLAVLTSNRRAILAVLRRLGELKSRAQILSENGNGKEEENECESVEKETVEDKGDENQAAVTTIKTPKPFEFRERLWHEPPEGDYEPMFGFFEAIQKEFKEIGTDLEWRTQWLDMVTVRNFLNVYWDWAYQTSRMSG